MVGSRMGINQAVHLVDQGGGTVGKGVVVIVFRGWGRPVERGREGGVLKMVWEREGIFGMVGGRGKICHGGRAVG